MEKKKMNKYHIKKKQEYWNTKENIEDFMKWGLNMTYVERVTYLIKEGKKLITSLLEEYMTLIEVFLPLFTVLSEKWNEILNDY